MKKKIYSQPTIDVINIVLSVPVLAGSPTTGNVNMGGGGGGSIDPD